MRVDRYRAPHTVSCSVGGSGSGVRGFVFFSICGTRVRSFVCQTTSTVTKRRTDAGSCKCPQAVWERHVPPLRAMEESLYGTIWNMVSLLMTTDAGR